MRQQGTGTHEAHVPAEAHSVPVTACKVLNGQHCHHAPEKVLSASQRPREASWQEKEGEE